MTGQQYEHYIKIYRQHPRWIPVIANANKLLTAMGYFLYPLLILYLLYTNFNRLTIYIFIPALAFVAVSIFRKVFNRPRPYEDPEIHALKPRNKKGQSFPSRHVFSFFIISVLYYPFYPFLCFGLLILGAYLAYIRVVLGVHYPIDVLAGAMIGILGGILTILL